MRRGRWKTHKRSTAPSGVALGQRTMSWGILDDRRRHRKDLTEGSPWSAKGALPDRGDESHEKWAGGVRFFRRQLWRRFEDAHLGSKKKPERREYVGCRSQKLRGVWGIQRVKERRAVRPAWKSKIEKGVLLAGWLVWVG